MRKFIIILFSIVLITGCSQKKLENKPKINQKKEKTIIEKPKYIDSNPVKVGFYDDNKNLITNYKCSFPKYKDMLWIDIFPSNESKLNYTTLKDTWERYKEQYNNINYKFGINIKFSTIKNENFNLTLLKPSDNAAIFNYIQIYLYDGYNTIASWYDHLEDNEITENTVLTSIKLTGSTYIDEVNSPITLTVFTYDSMDDFDSNSEYIGNSKHTITIEKIN